MYTRWLAPLALLFLSLAVSAQPSNDECSGALPLTVTTGGAACTFNSINTTGATQSSNPTCTSTSNNDDVWFTFVAPSEDVIFSYENFTLTAGTSSGLGYALFDACGGTQVACDFTFGDASTGAQTVTGLTPGTTYYLQTFAQGSSSFVMVDFCIQEINCTPPAGMISTVTQTGCPTGVSFEVEVTSLGSATSLSITSTAQTAPVTVTAPGTYLVGPIPNSLNTVEFFLESDQDAACIVSVGSFIVPGCNPPAPDQVCVGVETNVFTDSLESPATTSFTGDINMGNRTWLNITGGTPSSSTGPDMAGSGNGYLYYEASNGFPGDIANVISPAIDLTGDYTSAELSFLLHAYGSDIGTLTVGVSTLPTGPFIPEFTYSNQLQTTSGRAWRPVGIDLADYLGETIYVEFFYERGDDFRSDIAIDLVQVLACGPIPVSELEGCTAIASEVVDGSFTPGIVNFHDADGRRVCSIVNNKNLGNVQVSLYKDAQGPRSFNGGTDYDLGRSVTITPEFQLVNTEMVTVAIFATGQEIDALIAADPQINSIADLQFAKTESTSCSTEYPGSGEGLQLSTQSYNGTDWALITRVNRFSEFFVTSQSAILPVELTTFTARAAKAVNVLEWSSATEVDFSHYVVERSADGLAFAPFTSPIAPRGRANFGADYTMEDPAPGELTYYRLRMEDLDGSVAFSDVVSVRRTDAKPFRLAPNPATHAVNLTFATAAPRTVQLTDVTGRRYGRYRTETTALTLPLTDLPTGVYLVTVSGPAGRSTERLVVR